MEKMGMKNSWSKIFFLSILMGLVSSLSAQIEVLPVGSMRLKQEIQTLSKSDRNTSDTLSLPFFEDFSDPFYRPNTERWIGNSVLINTTYPINPPSIGVATFDGLDANGEPYGSSDNQGPGDTLTSCPIDLAYPASDSIYLSFYYQPKGIGNYPEFVDSFLLEFKNPTDSVWDWAWGTKGEDFPQTQKQFLQVMIPIRDTMYLKKGFQFRFRNYAQQNGSWDHWHLDYIRLNTNRFRTDTSTVDYSFMYTPSSILRDYQSVPLWHFLPNAIDNMAEEYSISMANISIASTFQVYKYYYYNYGFAFAIRDSFTASKGPLQPRQEYLFTEPVKYTFEDPGTEWTEYILQHYISLEGGEPDFNIENDTVEYNQILSNYYALDDGSAEERLSLNNNGGGFVAQRFDTYLADSLKSVQFYFNKTNEIGSGQEFFLMIWGGGANQPGELLYSQEAILPLNEGLNRFVTYELETPIYLPAGSYYFGWSQSSNFPMNVGFDRNINSNDRIFYDLSGTWYNFGAQEGTLMIRPLFRYANDIYVSSKTILNQEQLDFNIFPNPARDEIQLSLNSEIKDEYIVQIFDLTGRLVSTSDVTSKSTRINTTALNQGLYIIRLMNTRENKSQVKKLIISR